MTSTKVKDVLFQAESDKNPPKKRQKMEKKAKVVEQLPGRATVKSE